MTEKMPNIKSKFVMLFKAPKETEEDNFVVHLKNAGYNALSIPVLAFKFVNTEKLASCLQELDSYSAVIFTSPRTVQAAVLAAEHIQSSESGPLGLDKIKCYVVGKSTGAAAKKAGFKPEGEGAGNASELADIIIAGSNSEGTKPFLYPCSNLRRDIITEKLKGKDFTLNEVTVYETCPNESLETVVKSAVSSEGLPEFAVFFSPSGVLNTEHIVAEGILPLQKIKVVALGPTTNKELVSRGFSPIGTAKKPDPASLVEVLKQDLESADGNK
ncbi:uroporphyrinogen-III synthase-like [Gigantopelta aegis]|uniref:uroporphyrinogen-III synthase-like n=1 Tax=Gigantopelta aegis TaxID=1735272 RepID=UPI001B88B111|nr:uroporphyrinogen-III synthase-like [Gigantopelta aegis]